MIMTSFDDEYWNLCQAAVWIEFRERALVERFVDADGDAYRALQLYPTMWPPDRVRHGTLDEFYAFLKSGSLKASGSHCETPDKVEDIPPIHWYDIDLRPPRALDVRERGREVWTRVRVRRPDVLRLWPVPTEKHDRSWFDWAAVRALHDEMRAEHPDLSERQAILELQVRYERQFKSKPPGRTSLQKRIRRWRSTADDCR